jgi:amino acid transporter
MILVIGFTLIGLFLLSMALGIYKPAAWNEFTEKKIKTLKVITFVGFIGMSLNVVSRIM